MRGQRAVFALVLCLVLMVSVAASPAKAQSQVTIDTGNFVGTFTISDVSDQDGQTLARGILTGTLQTPSGPVSVVKIAALPVNALNDPNALASLVNDLLAAVAR